MKRQKNRVLLFIKLPPPTTGATLMNKRVCESTLLNEKYNLQSIKISYMDRLNEMGKWKMKKVFKVITVSFTLVYKLITQRPKFVYFQISPLNFGFYRDLLYVSIIKLFQVKIVYHLHGKGIKQQVTKNWKKELYKFAFKGSDIICLSHLLTFDIEDVFNGKIHIVNNGIPDIDKKYLHTPFLEKKDEIKILFLSNLIKSKGILDFIESLDMLNKKKLSFKAIIVGGEADLSLKDLQDIINNKSLMEKIKYIGPKYDDEKSNVIANSDVLVFPTKMQHETFGIINLEAMQFSKPIISTNIAAIPEIIDNGKTGFIVEKNSPKQIAEKLEILIKNPELRVNMGKAGRRKYEEKYTLHAFEKNMNAVFEKVLCELNK